MNNQPCPRCDKMMTNMGNVSCIVYLTQPPQWDDVHACRDCLVRVTVRVRGKPARDTSWLEEYEDMTRKQGEAAILALAGQAAREELQRGE